MDKFYNFIEIKVETPTLFGLFHITFLVLFTVALIFILKHTNERTDIKRALLYFSTISLIMEAIKQFYAIYSTAESRFTYNFYSFPFHFCSTPMYVGLIAYFVKNKKVYEGLLSFLATYSFFAGLTILILPDEPFNKNLTNNLYFNIQTLIHHFLMIVMALMIIKSKVISHIKRPVVMAMPYFVIITLMGIGFNSLIYLTGWDREINLFKLNPFLETRDIFLIGPLFEGKSFLFLLLTYLVIFTYISHLCYKYLNKLTLNKKVTQEVIN